MPDTCQSSEKAWKVALLKAQVCNQLARTVTNKAHYFEKAERTLRPWLVETVPEPVLASLLVIVNNHAVYLQSLHKPRTGIQVLSRYLSFFQASSSGDTHLQVAATYYNLSSLNLQCRLFRAAAEYAEQGLAHLQQHLDTRPDSLVLLVSCFYNLGLIHRELGPRQRAQEAFDQALKLCAYLPKDHCLRDLVPQGMQSGTLLRLFPTTGVQLEGQPKPVTKGKPFQRYYTEQRLKRAKDNLIDDRPLVTCDEYFNQRIKQTLCLDADLQHIPRTPVQPSVEALDRKERTALNQLAQACA